MAKVKAAYNYSYDYEGLQITFTIGEEFQLLSKANKDWWQVRRWKEGAAQDIYVPAVYMREVKNAVKPTVDPLYENTADLMKQMKTRQEKKKAKAPLPPKENGTLEKEERPQSPQYAQPTKPNQQNPTSERPIVKKRSESSPGLPQVSGSPTHVVNETSPASSLKSSDPEAKENGLPAGKPVKVDEHSAPSPTTAPRRGRSAKKENSPPASGGTSSSNQSNQLGIKEGWMPMYAMPVTTASKARSKSVNVDKRGENPSSSPPQESTSPTSPASPTGKQPPVQIGVSKIKIPPPVAPRGGPRQTRPKSMMAQSAITEEIYENAVASLASTFLSPSAPTNQRPPPSSTFQQPPPSSTFQAPPTSTFQPPPTSTFLPPPSSEVKQPAVKQHSLELRKTPSPKTIISSKPTQPTPAQNGSPTTPTPPTSSAPPLPKGWTEHKTDDGHTYYHNSLTSKSSWTRPLAEEPPSPNKVEKPLERVAPRGWTKEISPFTTTPVFTNCRTGEKWALASDGAGNYYYYNMSNPSLTMGELPEIDDIPRRTSADVPAPDHLYDILTPKVEQPRPRTYSDPKILADQLSPRHVPSKLAQSQPSGALHSQFQKMTASVLKKHGYLHRKKLYDAQGKKVRAAWGSWQKSYVVLEDFKLQFHSDHKVAKDTPGAKPQATFSLLQATVAPFNKEKRKNVFQVSSSFGEQFLLQAETPPLMNDWYSTIQTAIDKVNTDYQQHPDRYKGVLEQSLEEAGENSPKLRSKAFATRQQSRDLEDDYDPMDDLEISAADKTIRIRSRLKKLMAKRPQLETLKKSGIMEDPVFGCELGRLCERDKSNVPKFLLQFMDHIEKNGLDSVGLYRLSGNAASVQKLRCIVEQDDNPDLDDPNWTDINIVTGCLKLFLRELPEPVVPFRCFRGFIDAARSGTAPQRLQAIAARVGELPTPNYCTLKTLMKHLRKVVEYGHVNKMQATNLAIVFGPTIMRPEQDTIEMATLMPVQNGIAEVMITEFNSIFRK